MSATTVTQRGTDTSGRAIKETNAAWAAWDAACAMLGFTPTIVQGGFMGASGAAASAGTHAGDAFDVRLWDRTQTERDRMIHVFRDHGFAYWERYESQGFDLHAHLIPGPWASPAPGALNQWRAYLAGRNGLASNGADYHYRPSPLVTSPPKETDDMPYTEKQLTDIVQAAVKPLLRDQTKTLVKRVKLAANQTRKIARQLSAKERAELEKIADELEALGE